MNNSQLAIAQLIVARFWWSRGSVYPETHTATDTAVSGSTDLAIGQPPVKIMLFVARNSLD